MLLKYLDHEAPEITGMAVHSWFAIVLQIDETDGLHEENQISDNKLS